MFNHVTSTSPKERECIIPKEDKIDLQLLIPEIIAKNRTAMNLSVVGKALI